MPSFFIPLYPPPVCQPVSCQLWVLGCPCSHLSPLLPVNESQPPRLHVEPGSRALLAISLWPLEGKRLTHGDSLFLADLGLEPGL